MQRGERQQERTEAALIGAFLQLIQEKGYSALTIQEICARANVGRSTFYRHFASKADLLLRFHEGIFAQVALVYATPEQWLAQKAPPQVIQFLQRMQPTTALSTFSLYRFGPDIDYLFRNMDKLMTKAFTQSLVHAFGEQPSTIPYTMLAASIAGIYSTGIRTWLTSTPTMTADAVATYIQRLVRATLQAALEQEQPRTH